MPLPERDRALLEGAGFEIRETAAAYHVVPIAPPAEYDRDHRGDPIPVGMYLKCLQVGDGMFRSSFDSPLITAERRRALQALGHIPAGS